MCVDDVGDLWLGDLAAPQTCDDSDGGSVSASLPTRDVVIGSALRAFPAVCSGVCSLCKSKGRRLGGCSEIPPGQSHMAES